jgi:signal transduction histidine kinase/phage shock protein PspC (stress-responsive transcriptional regulator)
MSAAHPEASQPPPLRRDRDGAVLGGVCTGLGRRLGLDPIVLRVAFIAATAAGGIGAVAYALLWAALPAEGEARAGGLRVPRVPGGRDSWSVAGGIGMLVLALLLLFRQWGLWVGDALVWPVVLAAAGGGLIWRQSARAAEPAPARDEPARAGGGSALGRAGLGIALVVGAGLIFLYFNHALRPARDALLPVVVVLVAGALILAPWWIRLVRGLADERAERIRSQERAEMAAHLHDSVLQTLAMMQRRADDPREVAALARRQERELRAWLNGGRRPGERGTLAAALELAAAEVEEDHGVPVEVVAVGDAPLDEQAEALVAAAREAMVNAAKFADGAVSVYAGVEGEEVEVFVRDRGAGFELDAVPADRRGVRESIVGRMERHGGSAQIHSVAGEGTEVELRMRRA